MAEVYPEVYLNNSPPFDKEPEELPPALVRVDHLREILRALNDLDRLGQVAVLRAALEIILADRV